MRSCARDVKISHSKLKKKKRKDKAMTTGTWGGCELSLIK